MAILLKRNDAPRVANFRQAENEKCVGFFGYVLLSVLIESIEITTWAKS
jgi:hypothetical protein